MTDTERNDLRVLILTKVMGWSEVAPGRWMHDERLGPHGLTSIDDPLTDLNAAFDALEAWVKKSGADYGCLEFGFDSEKMYWNVIIGPKHAASDDSLPLAICKALAKAIGGGD